jgi:hypothetical protein
MNYLQKKKLAFMSIVNKVKGFVRTVSGIPPLTLPNCVDEESVIDYTIEGASGGVGDLTENLFDNAKNWSGTGGNAIPSYGSYLVQKLDGGGYHIGSHSSVSFVFNNLVAGETYTLSYILTADAKGITTNMIYIGSAASYVHCYSQGSWKTVTKTFTVDDSGSITFKFGISNSNGGGNDLGGTITELMLVQGSIAKEYEPYGYKIPIVCNDGITINLYLSAQLRKIGDYADYINFKNQNVTQRIGVKVFDGSENWIQWQYASVDGYEGYYVMDSVDDGAKLCIPYMGENSHFSVLAESNSVLQNANYACWTIRNNGAFTAVMTYIKTNIATLDEFKVWLAEEYANGTPVTIHYVYEVSNEEKNNIPILPTAQGTTIYTVGTEVQPTMEVTYYSTQKG